MAGLEVECRYSSTLPFSSLPFPSLLRLLLPCLSLPSFLPSLPLEVKKGKGCPYSITERRVPELIPVLDSQPAGDVSHKPGGRLPLLSARPTVTPPQPLRGLLPILLRGEQRHNGCEQFA